MQNSGMTQSCNPPSNISPAMTPAHSQLPSPLSLGSLSGSSHRQMPSDQALGPVVPIAAVHPHGESPLTMASLGRVRLADIVPYDGAPAGPYVRAVEALSGSLMRHNAVVIELGSEDAALMRCGLESARLYFRTRNQATGGSWGKGSKGVYSYRAGRALADSDSSPPCMAESFRCMGKAARAALCAIARHLRLRSDEFNKLLDDTPLPVNEVSSSVLVATYIASSLNGKAAVRGGKPSTNGEVEKGLLTLFSSDNPGIQVCDPNSRWYLADGGSSPGDLLLVTGKALSHATAGLCPAASYRASLDYSSTIAGSGRTSLAFRLMPQGNATLDCSPIRAAGHVIPQSYVPISVSQFMDDLSAEDDVYPTHSDNTFVAQNDTNIISREPSLRSVLSDPLSGAFLEDAVVVSCGHSFGGLMLRKVLEMSRCILCGAELKSGSLIPNHALRAAATAVKHEDDRRLFHNATLRKRRKEVGEQTDSVKRLSRENGDFAAGDGLHRGVQYPFSVNEKVVIKGNRRTPEKFVGKEAVITSQCLNGWYLLKILGSGESVRLQYRSLRKILTAPPAIEDRCTSQTIQTSS